MLNVLRKINEFWKEVTLSQRKLNICVITRVLNLAFNSELKHGRKKSITEPNCKTTFELQIEISFRTFMSPYKLRVRCILRLTTLKGYFFETAPHEWNAEKGINM